MHACRSEVLACPQAPSEASLAAVMHEMRGEKVVEGPVSLASEKYGLFIYIL